MDATHPDARSGGPLLLADGRRLAYTDTGDPGGTPVVFCHGWMASRLAHHPDDDSTRALGVRLVTVDRPGIGRSDPASDVTFASFAGDVEELAAHLGLDRFRVLAHSGGGPFALACAARLAGRVERAAVVSGFAPFDRPDAYAGMTPRMRGFTRVLRRAPWLAGPLLRGAPRRYRRDAERAFAKQFGPLCDADRAALDDEETRSTMLSAAVEALAGGSAAVAHEAKLLFCRPWGFAPAAVRCPVDLWYGDADTIVPADMGRYLASVLPEARLDIVPGQGHMLFITRWSEILRRLVAA